MEDTVIRGLRHLEQQPGELGIATEGKVPQNLRGTLTLRFVWTEAEDDGRWAVGVRAAGAKRIEALRHAVADCHTAIRQPSGSSPAPSWPSWSPEAVWCERLSILNLKLVRYRRTSYRSRRPFLFSVHLHP